MKRTNVSVPYYEDMSRISNSNVGQYLKFGPRYLRDMLDGKIDGMNASFLARGTMIHAYILQPEDFWNEYVILDFDVPTSKQQKAFCDNYAQLMKTDPLEKRTKLILNAYNASYNNAKSEATKNAEGSELISTYAKYIEYLCLDDPRIQISFADLQMCSAIKKNLMAHKLANKLLFNIPTTTDSANEFHINWEHGAGKLLCKSLIDRVMIDHETKTITLIDLKTTASLYTFEESVGLYSYKRQLAYYWKAISWYFENELKLDIMEYSYETYIIAVSTSSPYPVRVFSFDRKEFYVENILINYNLDAIEWHAKNGKWDQKKEYYDGNGAEKLNI